MIPFNPISVPKEEGEIIYKEFEAALAQTGAYVLIDREEIINLLGDGESSLFNCTSESCAVDIAKQVAAAQVIRGSLLETSSGYVLKIQILDVSNGGIVFLEEVSKAFFSQMRDSIDLLAHKIAGYVTIQYGNPVIARRFTEVFIETNPSRAEIYINGIRKGISPDIITRVPVGRISISARHGNFYGEQTLDVTPDTRQVRIECREIYGALNIGTEHDMDVYFDNRWLGKVTGGLFGNLPIGIHKLELIGEGGGRHTDIEGKDSVPLGIPEYLVDEVGKIGRSFTLLLVEAFFLSLLRIRAPLLDPAALIDRILDGLLEG